MIEDLHLNAHQDVHPVENNTVASHRYAFRSTSERSSELHWWFMIQQMIGVNKSAYAGRSPWLDCLIAYAPFLSTLQVMGWLNLGIVCECDLS